MGKIGRATFLYMESDDKDFAQCVDCRIFVPKSSLKDKAADRCIFHGSKVKVDEQMSCGLFVKWPSDKPEPEVIKNHAAELEQGIEGSVKPEESGLVDRRVRCENCFYGGGDDCKLYQLLNEKLPDVFDLETKIKPRSCCNAQTPKGGKWPPFLLEWFQA